MPSDFNAKVYISLNPDLHRYSEDQATTHYLNHGFFEKRKYKTELPSDFNANTYISPKPDLHRYFEDQATTHCLDHGFYENRKYRNNVFHITHYVNNSNKVYIGNNEEFYNNYRHIIVTVNDDNQFCINDKNIKIEKLTNIIANFCDILVVHMSLYYGNGYKVAFNMVDYLRKKLTRVKILFVDDYFSLLPLPLP